MNYIFNKYTNRQFDIMIRLLNYETLSYNKLSDNYFVSRSSISHDFHQVKKFFQLEHAQLCFNNSGTFFTGTEKQAQRLLKRIIVASIKEKNNLVYINSLLYQQTKEIIQSHNERHNILLLQNYSEDLIITTALLIYRSNNGFHLREDNQSLIISDNLSPDIEVLLQQLEKLKYQTFSKDERLYLIQILISNGFIDNPHSNSIEVISYPQAEHIISKVADALHLPSLKYDTKLQKDLTYHLSQLFTRLKIKNTILNPLLNDIKRRYGTLLNLIKYTLSDMLTNTPLLISDDEISFITLHFQAAIERLQVPKKIVIVCPNGIGFSSYINAKLEKSLPNIHDKLLVSVKELKELDTESIAFVISTVPISNYNKPIVQISQLCTPTDLKRILEAYSTFQIQQVSQLNSITQELALSFVPYIYKGDFKTQDEALNFLLKKAIPNKYQRNILLQSILEREKLQSTYLDNGIAIPHANPELVDTSYVNILILKKPIPWGVYKTDIIVLILTKQEDIFQIGEIMSFLIKGVEHKTWLLQQLENLYESNN